MTNTSEVIGGYSLRVLGVDPEWAGFDQPEPRLFPGESTTARLSLRLPDKSPAGDRALSIQVTDLQNPADVVVEEAILEIPAAPRSSIELDPPTLTGGSTGGYTAIVHNEGNTTQLLRLDAVDPEARTTFTFTPPELRLTPGSSAVVDLTVKARRPLVGDAALRPFTVRAAGPQVRETDGPPAVAGMFIQQPMFSRGLLGLMGLLVAITVFATVITIALSSIVQRTAADRDLALQVAQAREATSQTGRSEVGGSVVELSTGAPAAGVSVELFAADDPGTPLTTTATDDAGAFTFARLPAGEVLLRVRGAGFAEVWYPTAGAAADATPLTLVEGQSLDDLVVIVGGVPAAVSGAVVGDDVGGATVRVELPLEVAPLAGQVDPVAGEVPSTTTGGGALVRSVPISEDGTFEIADLPSPAVYDLVVTKPGFAPSAQRLDLAAGESRDGIELALLVGDGSIEGTVSGPDGPIGGAGVVATAGQARVETVSLTQDPVGGFVLRGLPTPGSYTVVVSADGYATATLTLSLTPGQQLTGVSVVLGRDQGTLGGTVTVPGSSAGGVTVTVSDGATTLQTVTRSTDPVGSWELSGLRVPGDYTVTFSRTDLESRVLSVSLDGFGLVTAGAASATSVDATMRSATAVLTGRVTQTRGEGSAQAVGNVVVTISSGSVERIVTTASTPSGDVGVYRIENLPPGTYTVTFARSGTRTTSEIVVLSAAQVRTLNPVLVAPARITGVVTQGGEPLAGRTVWLYRAAEYGTSAAPVAQTTTDASGGYALDDIEAPEHYVVEIRTTGGTVVGSSAPFTLDASEDRTVDIEVGEQPQ
ncbi:hypothetical protein GCM10027067_33610 [Pseudactinotalea suaedae]